jgi:hypothetical protein
LAALKRLTVERVQRSCGGFSEDDVTWQAGLWECGEAMDELCDAGWVRFTGFDDEQCEVPCYALVEPEVVGMQAGETRYGVEQLVALEVVGVPVRREPAIDDELSWLRAREARLQEVRVQLATERRWCEWEMLCARLARVYVRSDELWRRWREGAGAVANGMCKSLVVVGEGRGA